MSEKAVSDDLEALIFKFLLARSNHGGASWAWHLANSMTNHFFLATLLTLLELEVTLLKP